MKKTNWTASKPIKVTHIITKEAIDAAQDKQISALHAIDEKHNKQLETSMIVDTLYLVWLVCITWVLAAK